MLFSIIPVSYWCRLGKFWLKDIKIKSNLTGSAVNLSNLSCHNDKGQANGNFAENSLSEKNKNKMSPMEN